MFCPIVVLPFRMMPNSAPSAVLPSVPLPLLLLRSPRRSLHLSPNLLRSPRRFSPLRFRQFSLSRSPSSTRISSSTPVSTPSSLLQLRWAMDL